MTSDAQLDRPVDRRFLIRGGAVLAGAAGATALAAALNPTKASAADGDPVDIGESNEGTSTTSLRIGGATGSTTSPTLSLTNASGPSLALQPVGEDFEWDLQVGQIANTEEGPQIGVDYGGGPTTTYLLTELDLETHPVTFPFGPDRLLDTRTTAGRSNIIRTSAGALDDAFRLRGRSWLDVAVGDYDDFSFLLGVFFNLTVARPATSGYLTAYPPDYDERPIASTLNFLANANLSNGTYVAPSQVQDFWAVRIYASQTTHVVLDLTGITIASTGFVGEEDQAKKSERVTRRQARQAKMRARLAKSIGQRATR